MSEMGQPLFSVIVPAYNRADLVPATLRSVLSQDFCARGEVEVIAVDDGSTDGTLGVLRSFEPAVRVFTQANQGLSATRNRAASEARGRYIVPLDSDDLHLPWTLETLAQAVREGGEPSVVSIGWRRFREDAEPATWDRAAFALERHADLAATGLRGVQIGPSAVAIRADAWRAVGGCDVVRCNLEDVDLWFKLAEAPGYVHVRAPIGVAYRVGHAQMMGNPAKTVEGFRWIAGKMRSGGYSHLYGGTARAARARRRGFTWRSRAASVQMVRAGHAAHAMALWGLCPGWNVAEGRIDYLAALPGMALAHAVLGRKSGGGWGDGGKPAQGMKQA